MPKIGLARDSASERGCGFPEGRRRVRLPNFPTHERRRAFTELEVTDPTRPDPDGLVDFFSSEESLPVDSFSTTIEV